MTNLDPRIRDAARSLAEKMAAAYDPSQNVNLKPGRCYLIPPRDPDSCYVCTSIAVGALGIGASGQATYTAPYRSEFQHLEKRGYKLVGPFR